MGNRHIIKGSPRLSTPKKEASDCGSKVIFLDSPVVPVATARKVRRTLFGTRDDSEP